MADSYRLAPLKKLTDHLKQITPANGYVENLSDNVFRGRTVFGDADPLPLVSILESPRGDSNPKFADDYSQRADQLTVFIQGWVVDDVENPTDPAYALMDEVETHLMRLIATDGNTGNPKYPDEYLLGRTVTNVTILPGTVRPPGETSSKAFFYLPIRLGLAR